MFDGRGLLLVFLQVYRLVWKDLKEGSDVYSTIYCQRGDVRVHDVRVDQAGEVLGRGIKKDWKDEYRDSRKRVAGSPDGGIGLSPRALYRESVQGGAGVDGFHGSRREMDVQVERG